MALIMDTFIEILKKPSIVDVAAELAAFTAPIWIAILVGMFIGWAWRPRWAGDVIPGVGGQEVESASFLTQLLPSYFLANNIETVNACSSATMTGSDELAVMGDDLAHLCQLVQVSDGGPEWHPMMEKSMPGFTYRAWKREPETGPPEYRSSTIFDSAAPEVVRDFFWDDEFRTKNRWDDMLLQHTVLEECENTGTMVVRWVRKFPIFCSNREYIIGRRIWEVDGTYYCVTKGVPRPSVPRHKTPRRVDLYYSSWCIRAVESRRGDGTACEVLLFHHEDMGIPWEIAKLGVRQGMWGCVRKIEPGLRAYEISRSQGEPISRYATMAGINTKIRADYLRSMELSSSNSSKEIVEFEKPKPWCGNIPKLLLIGGTVAVACSLDRGLLTKAVIFGVARRFGRLGR